MENKMTFKDAIIKRMILIRGASGSGKSTMAREILKDHPEGRQFETDDLFYTDYRDDDQDGKRQLKGEYKFDFTKLKINHEKNRERVKKAMENGVNPIIVSNTFIEKWEMQAYLDLAKQFDYAVEIKIARGQYKNLHGVPEDKVAMMRNNFEE